MLREYTGYDDRLGNHICTLDLVSFRCPEHSISGKGVVVKGSDVGCPEWEFCIQDTRKAPDCKKQNEGRIYPFYEDAVYNIRARAMSEEEIEKMKNNLFGFKEEQK